MLNLRRLRSLPLFVSLLLLVATARADVVAVAPSFVTQPIQLAPERNGVTVLQAKATGDALAYQWYRGPTGDTLRPIPGATSDLLVTPSLTPSTPYWVRVSNTLGSIDSQALTVANPAGSYILQAKGDSSEGQLGLGLIPYQATPLQIATDVSLFAPTYRNHMLLKTDGALWIAGNFVDDRQGYVSPKADSFIPQELATGVTTLAAFASHGLFSKTDGSLWGVGINSYGQLGDFGSYPEITPRQIAPQVTRFAASEKNTYYIKADGSLWGLGSNAYGQLGGDPSFYQSTPLLIDSEVTSITVAQTCIYYIKNDGSLWVLGRPHYLPYYPKPYPPYAYEYVTPILIASGVNSITLDVENLLFIKTEGSLWGLGDNTYNQLSADPQLQHETPIQLDTGVSKVSPDYGFILYTKNDGSLWGRGKNDQGQIGDGTFINRTTPYQIASSVNQVFTRYGFAIYIKTDGTLWGQGDNSRGQLGDGTFMDRTAPLLIAADVTQASTGYAHVMFLKTDGSLWAMGSNDYYQLGDGTRYSPLAPIQIATDVATVQAVGDSTLWIKKDRSLWSVGVKDAGTLGLNGAAQPNNYITVATNVSAVSAAWQQSFFIKTDGSLWAAGENRFGQLGDGSTFSRATPVQIAQGVSAVSADREHTVFLKADGSLWAMGLNDRHQYGDNPNIYNATPVQIATDVAAASAGAGYTVYIKTDHSLWVFGDDYPGQTAGATYDGSLPKQIALGVAYAYAANKRTIFIKTDGTLWAVGHVDFSLSGYTETNFASPYTYKPVNQVPTPVKIADGAIAASSDYFSIYWIKPDVSLWAVGGAPWSRNYHSSWDGYPAIDAENSYLRTPRLITNQIASITPSSDSSFLHTTDYKTFKVSNYGLTNQVNLSIYSYYSQWLHNTVAIAAGWQHTLVLRQPTDRPDYTTWAYLAGLTGLAHREADPEGDDLPNWLEYVYGSSPTTKDSDAVQPTTTLQDIGGQRYLVFNHRHRKTDSILFDYELNTRLDSHWGWQWQTVNPTVIDPDVDGDGLVELRSVAFPLGDQPALYLRLKLCF